MKIKIRDSKSLKDSIEHLKKKIMDVEIDLTQKGINSIANALLAKKEEINKTQSFEDLRNLVVPVIKEFDTPKGREMLMKIGEFERLYNREPVKGSRNDYWLWEKLLKYVWNIVLKASGNPSPDVKEQPKDSCQDEEIEEVEVVEEEKDFFQEAEEETLKVCRLLGEAHDKFIEALDLIEEMENEDKLPSSLRYEVEDLEAKASNLDYMGESNPVEKLREEWPLNDEGYDSDFDLDYEDED